MTSKTWIKFGSGNKSLRCVWVKTHAHSWDQTEIHQSISTNIVNLTTTLTLPFSLVQVAYFLAIVNVCYIFFTDQRLTCWRVDTSVPTFSPHIDVLVHIWRRLARSQHYGRFGHWECNTHPIHPRELDRQRSKGSNARRDTNMRILGISLNNRLIFLILKMLPFYC